MKEPLALEGVSETLLIPLMGRALEHKKEKGILKDTRSAEIFENLTGYDFGKFDNSYSKRSFLRTTIRTAIIDQWLKPFLKKTPGMTIVEIGCGLNTRFERLDNGKFRWFDLDVPGVFPVWQRFFRETARRRFLPFSAFDEAWMEQVKAESKGPYFFIAEASVIYFPEDQVMELLDSLHRNFPGSFYLFDTATPSFLKAFKQSKDALIHCGVNFQWTIGDVQLLKKRIPETEVLKTVELETTGHEFSSFYPSDFKPGVRGYRLNLIRV